MNDTNEPKKSYMTAFLEFWSSGVPHFGVLEFWSPSFGSLVFGVGIRPMFLLEVVRDDDPRLRPPERGGRPGDLSHSGGSEGVDVPIILSIGFAVWGIGQGGKTIRLGCDGMHFGVLGLLSCGEGAALGFAFWGFGNTASALGAF